MSHTWTEADVSPPLEPDAVHVWLVSVLDAVRDLERLVAVLSAGEQERIARFRFEEHRRRSQIARGLLRVLLSHYTGLAATALHFTYNAHGKPELPGAGLHFNTSHSGDYVALAFTRVAPVGVDIEQVRGDITRREQIAERHFAPGETRQLMALPESDRLRAFFDLWTRKEAFVKARGDGLFSGLDRFETLLGKPRLLTIEGKPAVNWWLCDLPEVPGYSGAVVVNATHCAPSFWKWRPWMKE